MTGAASGIGRAIALALAKEQTHGLSARYQPRGLAEEAAAAARAVGVEAVAAVCDSCSRHKCPPASQMLDRWHHIDLLVNNVGVAYYGPTTT